MLRIHCLQLGWNLSDGANVNDVTQPAALLHGQEGDVFADAGYQGIASRDDAKDLDVHWHEGLRPCKCRSLDKTRERGRLVDCLEKLKASVWAKVEHPFRVVKQHFGYGKGRYSELGKTRLG